MHGSCGLGRRTAPDSAAMQAWGAMFTLPASFLFISANASVSMGICNQERAIRRRRQNPMLTLGLARSKSGARGRVNMAPGACADNDTHGAAAGVNPIPS